jgi:hypothetical protein
MYIFSTQVIFFIYKKVIPRIDIPKGAGKERQSEDRSDKKIIISGEILFSWPPWCRMIYSGLHEYGGE